MMKRLFVSILLVLAAFGLVLSPAAACPSNAMPAPVPVASSDCHGMSEMPEKHAPAKADIKACCKVMCAPAMLVAGAVLDAHLPVTIFTATHPERLAGIAATSAKPPPRSAA